MPSAWQVQQDLIRRVAQAQGEPPPADPDAWFGAHPAASGYDDVLAALPPTAAGCAALLRPYCRPDEEERAATLRS